MKNIDFKLIVSSNISDLADLLYKRQKNEIEIFPFLNNSLQNKQNISEKITNILNKRKTIGIGAYINEELVGYILGEVKIDNRRGRYISVPYEGVAVKEDQSYEILRLLYSKVSKLWLEQGCFKHSIIVPLAGSVYYNAFIRLSFAIEQVHAVLNMSEYVPFKSNTNATIRLANEGDAEKLENMSDIISKFQNAPPVYAPALPEVIESIKEGFSKMVGDNTIVFIAEENDQALGFYDYEIVHNDLMIPNDGIELCVAGVQENQMGKGFGKKLMNESYKYLIDKGYKYIKTDWRISNLASSNFWPRVGFKPIAYRMVRYIDANYSWANFSNPSIAKL